MTRGVTAGTDEALGEGEAVSCTLVAEEDARGVVVGDSVCVGAGLVGLVSMEEELACAVDEVNTADDPASSGGRKNIA